jgi:putative sigma-54 modulation protein
MQTVRFKNISPSKSLRSCVLGRLGGLKKMTDQSIKYRVVLSVEKTRHIAEVNFSCGSMNVQAKETSGNLYSSIDSVVDKIKTQIKKHNKKLRGHMSGDRQSIRNEAPPETV